MPQLKKAFVSAFVLEPAKLQRVLSVLSAAYDEASILMTFKATLKNGKEIVLHDVDELLQHDNTISNPIVELTVSARNEANDKRAHLYFYSQKHPYLPSITLTVEAPDLRWVNTLAAELEEQIERVTLRSGVHRVLQSVRLRNLTVFLIPLIFAAFVTTVLIDSKTQSRETVQQEQLVEKAKTAKTLDEKVDSLLKLQVHLVERKDLRDASIQVRLPTIDLQTVVAATPFVLVLALIYYAIRHCYPTAVFAWGDVGERYATTVQRRKTIWGVVFVALLLGLLINLSSSVLSRVLGM